MLSNAYFLQNWYFPPKNCKNLPNLKFEIANFAQLIPIFQLGRHLPAVLVAHGVEALLELGDELVALRELAAGELELPGARDARLRHLFGRRAADAERPEAQRNTPYSTTNTPGAVALQEKKKLSTLNSALKCPKPLLTTP